MNAAVQPWISSAQLKQTINALTAIHLFEPPLPLSSFAVSGRANAVKIVRGI